MQGPAKSHCDQIIYRKNKILERRKKKKCISKLLKIQLIKKKKRRERQNTWVCLTVCDRAVDWRMRRMCLEVAVTYLG